MHIKVVIIHPSEIIRNGLVSMIHRSFNLEVESYGFMKSIKESDKTFYVMFVDDELYSNSGVPVNIPESRLIIPVQLCMTDGVIIKGDEYRIDLNCTMTQIREVLGEIVGRYNEKSGDSVGVGELTIREREVLKQVASGHTNKDIATNLFISLHTVISHRKNITEKLGIKSISGLTVYAIMNNIIDKESLDIGALI